MSAERHLHPVDLETGELACERCQHLKIDDLERAEKEIIRLRRQNGRLEDKLAEKAESQRQTHKERQRIIELIERWKQKTNHPNSKSSNDRFDIIVARLRDGYTFDQIELAIDGIAAYPYVTKAGRQPQGSPSQRHDSLSLALRGGEHLERFANLAVRAKTSE